MKVVVPEPGFEADRDQVKAGETMSKDTEGRQGPCRQGPEHSLWKFSNKLERDWPTAGLT